MTNGSIGVGCLRIGQIDADPTGCSLTYNGTISKLSPRAMNVLIYLAQRPTQAITHEELLTTFWRGSLSTNAVHKCVAELRQVLNELGDNHTQIETVPKRGYRLIADVSHIREPTLGSHAVFVSVGLRTVLLKPIDGRRFSTEVRHALARVFEELTSRLRQFSGASMRFQNVADDRIPADLSNQFDPDYVIEFHVDRMDDRYVVRATLSPTTAGSPSQDEQMEFVAGDRAGELTEFVVRIVEDLAVLLDEEHLQRMSKWGTRNIRAYLLAREGDSFQRGQSKKSLVHAEESFRAALVHDPLFPYAYDSLTGVYESMADFADSSDSRELVRRKLQDLLREASVKPLGSPLIAQIERQYQWMSAFSGFDQERIWSEELTKNPHSYAALNAYAHLLIGANLLDESERYIARSIASCEDPITREVIEHAQADVTAARGDVERTIEIAKNMVKRFPDHTFSLYALVRDLAKLGRFAEAHSYLARLASSAPAWGKAAELVLLTRRGDIRLESQALKSAFDDPQVSNATRGVVCFVLGDIEGGASWWRKIEPAFLRLQWMSLPTQEWDWASGVVADPRYNALLDELDLGKRWRVYMREQATKLAPTTQIEVTTPLPLQMRRAGSAVD